MDDFDYEMYEYFLSLEPSEEIQEEDIIEEDVIDFPDSVIDEYFDDEDSIDVLDFEGSLTIEHEPISDMALDDAVYFDSESGTTIFLNADSADLGTTEELLTEISHQIQEVIVLGNMAFNFAFLCIGIVAINKLVRKFSTHGKGVD